MSLAPPTEEDLIGFLYACPVGLVEFDRSGAIGLANPYAMQHLLPLGGAAAASNLFTALEGHAPELRTMVERFEPRTGAVCDNHRIVVDLANNRRERLPKVLACTIARLGPDRYLATLSDISKQVAQEQRLQQADIWFAALLDAVDGYAMLAVQPNGIISAANDGFLEQSGHAATAVIGRQVEAVLEAEAGSSGLALADQIRIAARDGWFLDEGWQSRADRAPFWCQRLIVARIGQDGAAPDGFMVVLREVPRRDVGVVELKRLLTCDHLTGAANRMEFQRTLERARLQWRGTDRTVGLLLLDLDHFKTINDSHGHPVGDALLCSVARICTDALRPADLFARLGGEEFAALLPGTTMQETVAVGERLRAAIADLRVPADTGEVGVTASIGCATLAEAGASTDALISIADQRLYAAKHAGRDRVQGPEALAA